MSSSEECHRADLDALADRRVGWSIRILECAMTKKACPTVRFRFVGLKQQDVLRRHLWKVPPAVLARMSHNEDFAGTISIAQNHLEHVVRRGRGHVAHRQRLFLDAVLQRLPEVIESDAAL